MAKTCVGLLLVLAAASGLSGQANGQREERAVIVPQEVALQVIVPQPDCPLMFERAYALRYLDGAPGAIYELRHTGNKPISKYTVAIWTSHNTGNVITWHVNEDEGLLMPGQRVPSGQDSDIRIVPLSKELQDSLDLHPPMRGVIFFMIVEVVFSDATRYDAKKIFDNLKDHLRNFEPIYEKGIRRNPTCQPKLRGRNKTQ